MNKYLGKVIYFHISKSQKHNSVEEFASFHISKLKSVNEFKRLRTFIFLNEKASLCRKFHIFIFLNSKSINMLTISLFQYF